MESEGGQTTGTKDKDNIIWFTEQCLSNKGAEQGKQLLRARLAG